MYGGGWVTLEFGCAAGDGGAMRTELLRLDGTVEHDPAIDVWFEAHAGELGTMARRWFEVMRRCGDEVREVLHDGCPVACLGDVPFGYVNVFTAHVNVGFFQGAGLKDPEGLLQGTGKFMRHVKLRAGGQEATAKRRSRFPGGMTERKARAKDGQDHALRALIEVAYSDMKARVENG